MSVTILMMSSFDLCRNDCGLWSDMSGCGEVSVRFWSGWCKNCVVVASENGPSRRVSDAGGMGMESGSPGGFCH